MKKSIFAYFLCLLCFAFSSCIPSTYSFVYINSTHPRLESPHRLRIVYIDSAFGDADRVGIQDALNQWQYAMNGYVEFKEVNVDIVHGSMQPLKEANLGVAWMIMKIDSDNALVVFHDKPEHPALAFVEKIGGSLIYIVRNRIPNESMRGVVMHEVGHLFGAEHSPGGLMNPAHHDYDTQCVDKQTLEQVANYQHLPLNDLNYCVYTNDNEKEDNELITIVTLTN